MCIRDRANAILDVKMQTMGMTDEQAMDLMTKDAFQTQAEAEGKLARAKLSSTQLPTYYVGLREWLAFRKKYQAEAGKNFDMLKFHDLVLDQGPVSYTHLDVYKRQPGATGHQTLRVSKAEARAGSELDGRCADPIQSLSLIHI